MSNELSTVNQKQQATFLIVASVVIVALVIALVLVFASKNNSPVETAQPSTATPTVPVQSTVLTQTATPPVSGAPTSTVQSTPITTVSPSIEPSSIPAVQYLDVQFRSFSEDMGDGVAYYSFQACQQSSCKVYLLPHNATTTAMITDSDNKDYKISGTYTFKGIAAGSSFYVMSGDIKVLKKVQYKRLATEDGNPSSYIFEVSNLTISTATKYSIPESIGSSVSVLKSLTPGEWVYLSGSAAKDGAAAGTRYVTLKMPIEVLR